MAVYIVNFRAAGGNSAKGLQFGKLGILLGLEI